MKNSFVSFTALSAVLVATSSIIFSGPLLAQKSGQSMQIQYGLVIAAKNIQEQSNASRGALVGGAIGLYTGKGKSSGSKFRRTAGGAIAGGAAASAVQGDRRAKEYHVQTATGVTAIISDQREIVIGDCVIVEMPNGGNANIRRVASTYCDPASADVVAELQNEILEEAQECVAAKAELIAADTDNAVDRAVRKVSILCDM